MTVQDRLYFVIFTMTVSGTDTKRRGGAPADSDSGEAGRGPDRGIRLWSFWLVVLLGEIFLFFAPGIPVG